MRPLHSDLNYFGKTEKKKPMMSQATWIGGLSLLAVLYLLFRFIDPILSKGAIP